MPWGISLAQYGYSLLHSSLLAASLAEDKASSSIRFSLHSNTRTSAANLHCKKKFYQSIMAERSSTFLELHEDDPDRIAERLCNRFRLSVLTLNNRDYDHKTATGQEVQSYVSPDFRAHFDNIPKPMNWNESTEMWRAWQARDPDVYFEVMHCSCNVNLAKGEAIVIAEVKVTGSGDVTLGGLSEASWKRHQDGRWYTDFYIGIRGNPQNGGFV